MTSNINVQNSGLPEPITELTMEQDLKMRLLRDKINEGYYEHKEDIMTLFLALQHQNFVMGNSISNLVQQWPKPPQYQQLDPATIKEAIQMFGTLSEIKD